MIIFSSHPTKRFEYACSQVFRDLESGWEITGSEEKFNAYTGPKIRYNSSASNASDTCYFQATDGVWEDQMHIALPQVSQLNGNCVLFSNDSEIGFDLFAACFFMLSRWEEYLPFQSDAMQRFNAANSVFAADKSFRKPWVDIWIRDFQKYLSSKWPALIFKSSAYRFISTMDIDSAYAYRHKGLYRTMGGFAQDIARFDFSNLAKRLDALIGGPDSYNTYAYADKLLRRYGCQHLFFFLLADFGPHDKNLPHTSEGLCKLIRRIAVDYKLGIHPGIGSHQSLTVLGTEIARLKFILQNEVTMSRQHYLKLHLPETYRRLIECEITGEYSMGFADDVGFRAGSCRSFYWFDLEKNETTALCVHPFTLMETSLNKYLKLSPDEAIELIHAVNDEVRAVNGTFISLWHNETLSETKEWKGWRRVWEAMLQKANTKLTP